MPDNLCVDNTILGTLATCPTKVVIRHIHHLTTPTAKAELMGGKSGHTALSAFFQGAPVAETMALFQNEYKDWARANVSPNHNWAWENMSRIFRVWLDRFPRHKYKFLATEIPIEIPLADGITLTGRMDAVIEQGGALYVFENKFTGSVSDFWVGQFPMSSQISTYTWALEQIKQQYPWKDLPVGGAYVNAVQISKIPASNRQCYTHHMKYEECGVFHPVENSRVVGPFTRSRQFLERWKLEAETLALGFGTLKGNYSDLADIQEVEQRGPFNGQCRFCEFEDYCRLGPSPDTLRNRLIVDHWDPRDQHPVVFKGGTTDAIKPANPDRLLPTLTGEDLV